MWSPAFLAVLINNLSPPPSPVFRQQPTQSSHYQSKMSLTETITLPNGNKYEQPTGLFIGGEFVKSVDGKTFETINPSTEKPICSVQEASEKDVDIAV